MKSPEINAQLLAADPLSSELGPGTNGALSYPRDWADCALDIVLNDSTALRGTAFFHWGLVPLLLN